MAERKWTEAQREAIYHDSKNILVSAAAGSGKTAVLTKRIVEKLTDSEHPADISRMLIVTFTKAAANELKERIGAAITAAIAENPADKRLRRQYVLLSKAKISTIHGFCLDLIRQNFEKLGLSPSVSVSDPTQADLLMEQIADVVIDNYYAELPGYDNIENFVEFADNFISLKDDRLSDILISLYNKVCSFPRGVEFLADSAEEMKKAAEGGLYETIWGSILFDHLTEVFRYYHGIFSEACRYFDDGDIYSAKYYPSFSCEYTFVSSLLSCAEAHDIEGIKRQIFAHTSVPLKALKKEYQTDTCLYYRSCRNTFHDKLSKITENFFSQSETVLRQTAEKSYDFTRKLYLFLKAFENKYSAEKQIRGLLDFNDLERLTCRLLTDENGMPTEIARSVSADFDEIYIDEYQDVNKVQDMIFSAISSASSRFMVGDIKQSIYGFRGAEPSLFADYRRDDRVDKIFLQHNFRCDKPIIDFVNRVCGNLFRSIGKTVPYDNTDELVCGKIGGGEEEVEIHLIETGSQNASDRRTTEAEFTADRIAALLTEGIAPGDICILLRSASRAAVLYEDALEKRGIPCRNQVSKNLFVNPEVLLAMNLLNAIDNPSRDIYLAGVLKSPLYNFSLSDLVKIRKYEPKGSLYAALKRYTEEKDFEKGKYFLKKLEEYRALSGEPVDKLLWYILCDASFFALAVGGENQSSAAQKKSNLLMLYDYARKFENGSFKGLYNFIRYINDVLESGAGFDGAPLSADSENVVRVMTIHQSKGLEFPVVFLCDCGSSFSNADMQERVLIDRDYGVTFKLSDSTGLASYDTVYRRAEAIGISDKNAEEEIRVLYVALTRAVNRLIITASDADPDKLITLCRQTAGQNSSGYTFKLNSRFISWILIAAGKEYPPNIVHMTGETEETQLNPILPSAEKENPSPNFSPEELKALINDYQERFSFQYPHATASAIPAKLSVSELYPSILDEYGDSLTLSAARERNMKIPRFRYETKTSAAERGTATHQFMQFCDFAGLEKWGVEQEISRLQNTGFIDAHTAALIEREKVTEFTFTSLFLSLKSASFRKRELRFNIRLPAAYFTTDSQKREELRDDFVLVQGIMDCIFLDEKGRLTILDYKTDSIPRELRGHPEAFEKVLIERHRDQLCYYRAACEQMLCRPADRILLYSFALSEAVEIPLELLELS